MEMLNQLIYLWERKDLNWVISISLKLGEKQVIEQPLEELCNIRVLKKLFRKNRIQKAMFGLWEYFATNYAVSLIPTQAKILKTLINFLKEEV